MDIVSTIFSVFTTLCFASGFYPQTRDLLKRKISPRLVTWLVWATGDWIILVGILTQKVRLSALIIVATIGASLTFLLTLKFGKSGWETRDKVCLALSGLAIGIWLWLGNSDYGIGISLIGLWIAAYPMYSIARDTPETENKLTWALFNVANVFAIFAIPNILMLFTGSIPTLTFADVAPPIMFMVIDLPMIYYLFIRPRRRRATTT
jgi:hypothetical protein